MAFTTMVGARIRRREDPRLITGRATYVDDVRQVNTCYAAFVRSHFDGMEVQINDAPRANEIMVAVAVTDSGRPLARVGGLTAAEVKGEDGLR